jgi:hypothetical protein
MRGFASAEPFDRLKALSSIEGLSQTLSLPAGRQGLTGSNEDLPPAKKAVSQYEKTDFSEKRGEAVGWKRFRAVTFSRSDSHVPGV